MLQFNLANQIKAPEEDKLNKPSRSLPAGRITVRNGTILRWLIAPLCLAYSSLYGIQLVFASLEMQLFTYWYNEMDGDKNWLSKNVILAIMYGCTELGGTLISSKLTIYYSFCPIARSAYDPLLLRIQKRLQSLTSQRDRKTRSPTHYCRLRLHRALPRL